MVRYILYISGGGSGRFIIYADKVSLMLWYVAMLKFIFWIALVYGNVWNPTLAENFRK